MLLRIFSTWEQEFLSFLYGGLMRAQKRNAWAAGGPRQAKDHRKNERRHSMPLATSAELFSYAHAVAAAIPTLPKYLRPSTVRHFLSVAHAALIMARG